MTRNLRSKFLPAFLVILLLSVAAATSAQSLGEVARQCRKEREAREKKGQVPVKIFTNDDIARMRPIASLKSSTQAPSLPESKPSPPPQQAGAATSGAPASEPAAPSGKAQTPEKSKVYWQARFKAARARLAHAKEEQTLVEDELRLLQIQQARELNPDRSRELNGRIDAATVELEAKRAAIEKVRQAMEKLKKEFKDSGAPQAWIQVETTDDQ